MYEKLEAQMMEVVNGFRVLSGDQIGDPSLSWQETAAIVAADLRKLASLVDEARDCRWTRGPVVFPTFDEVAEV